MQRCYCCYCYYYCYWYGYGWGKDQTCRPSQEERVGLAFAVAAVSIAVDYLAAVEARAVFAAAAAAGKFAAAVPAVVEFLAAWVEFAVVVETACCVRRLEVGSQEVFQMERRA